MLLKLEEYGRSETCAGTAVAKGREACSFDTHQLHILELEKHRRSKRRAGKAVVKDFYTACRYNTHSLHVLDMDYTLSTPGSDAAIATHGAVQDLSRTIAANLVVLADAPPQGESTAADYIPATPSHHLGSCGRLDWHGCSSSA